MEPGDRLNERGGRRLGLPAPEPKAAGLASFNKGLQPLVVAVEGPFTGRSDSRRASACGETRFLC